MVRSFLVTPYPITVSIVMHIIDESMMSWNPCLHDSKKLLYFTVSKVQGQFFRNYMSTRQFIMHKKRIQQNIFMMQT